MFKDMYFKYISKYLFEIEYDEVQYDVDLRYFSDMYMVLQGREASFGSVHIQIRMMLYFKRKTI